MAKLPKPAFYTSAEVAALMGISTSELSRLRRAGRIPFHKFGPRFFRYRISDIKRWLTTWARERKRHG